MPTARSRSPVSVRIAAVTVRGGDAGDLAEQATTVQTVGAQSLGDGEHHLSVRHRREECRVQPLRPAGEPFCVAAGAEVATLAGEGQQILVRTVVAADAGEAVLQHAAGEERVGHLRDDGTPGAVLAREAVVIDRLQAVQMIRHQPKERRRLGPSGFVDATRRRRRVGHARSGTGERRADTHRPRGPSPFRGATGCFNANHVGHAAGTTSSSRITAHRKPTSSRATATTAICGRFR